MQSFSILENKTSPPPKKKIETEPNPLFIISTTIHSPLVPHYLFSFVYRDKFYVLCCIYLNERNMNVLVRFCVVCYLCVYVCYIYLLFNFSSQKLQASRNVERVSENDDKRNRKVGYVVKVAQQVTWISAQKNVCQLLSFSCKKNELISMRARVCAIILKAEKHTAASYTGPFSSRQKNRIYQINGTSSLALVRVSRFLIFKQNCLRYASNVRPNALTAASIIR